MLRLRPSQSLLSFSSILRFLKLISTIIVSNIFQLPVMKAKLAKSQQQESSAPEENEDDALGKNNELKAIIHKVGFS